MVAETYNLPVVDETPRRFRGNIKKRGNIVDFLSSVSIKFKKIKSSLINLMGLVPLRCQYINK